MEEHADCRVSSYSAGSGNCIEVGQARDAIVIRDTKNRDAGALSLSPAAWNSLLSAIDR